MTKVAKSFGALQVLRDVTFNVSKGEAVGVLGPNGAGKSTLFNLIAGELSLSGGKIAFDGVDLGSTRPDHRAALGIARSYQIPRPFTHMSVYENVLVGAVFGHGGKDDPHGLVVDVLARTGLAEYAAQPAGSLTLLNRKRLELARALAVRPQLILLDEIAGGLTPGECDALIALIAEIKATGTTVIWVEHIVHALVRVVDRLVVLASGQLIADGPPETVLASPEVQQIYMGAPKEPLDA